MQLSSDSTVAMSKTMGLTMISFADYFQESKPDYVILIADRYEYIHRVICPAKIAILLCSNLDITLATYILHNIFQRNSIATTNIINQKICTGLQSCSRRKRSSLRSGFNGGKIVRRDEGSVTRIFFLIIPRLTSFSYLLMY